MAVWELGRGWTFDTDEFVRVAESPLTAISIIAAPVSAPLAAVGIGARFVAKRLAVPLAEKAIVVGGKVIAVAGRGAAKIDRAVRAGREIIKKAESLLGRSAKRFSKLEKLGGSAYRWYRRYKIWKYLMNLFDGLVLDDTVVVTVKGNPNSSRQELYYLACAAAFSKVNRYNYFDSINLGIPPGEFCIEYDQSSRTIEVTLHYITSFNLVRTQLNKNAVVNLVLLKGPPSSLIGGKFSFESDIGSIGGVVNIPDLPYEGKFILTDGIQLQAGGEIVTNPKPPGDLRSRGSLYSLVYSALTSTTNTALKTFQDPTAASTSGPNGVIDGG